MKSALIAYAPCGTGAGGRGDVQLLQWVFLYFWLQQIWIFGLQAGEFRSAIFFFNEEFSIFVFGDQCSSASLSIVDTQQADVGQNVVVKMLSSVFSSELAGAA